MKRNKMLENSNTNHSSENGGRLEDACDSQALLKDIARSACVSSDKNNYLEDSGSTSIDNDLDVSALSTAEQCTGLLCHKPCVEQSSFSPSLLRCYMKMFVTLVCCGS
ncbi:unnamed protein product [Clavelina lepadiformis]|uniref:Uncharacterized protein n=1 Tax=Clavelina lepadiformis TaxID=159417 RepID=A0ABP0FBH4_CLALP